MIPKFIDKEKIPHKPGIYIYKDGSGKILYVGKAVDLYHRVASYFSGEPDSAKTAKLIDNILSVETIIVESELEALVLEANLIKKYLPPYNISLKDDKDYLYIVVTREDFPRVITGRSKDLKEAKKYFGPFPSSRTVKTTLKQLRRVFPWCSGRQHQKLSFNGQKACFYYHLGLCPGACIGIISKEDYGKNINRFIKFLEGKKEELLEELNEEMAQSSKKLDFEQAGGIKKMILGINYLTQSNRVSSYLENPNFLEDERRKALAELQRVLNLPQYPERIEAYDISNLAGKEATGSMVVLTNGEVDKSQYRKFKIHITGRPNDVGMHKEMMGRRLGNLDWGVPQLILIDGGRGQVRGVREQIVESIKRYVSRGESDNLAIHQFIDIPIYGLAKREEWLYPPEGGVVKLPKRSLSLRLLQKIRDESHRFAVTYHKKLRKAVGGY